MWCKRWTLLIATFGVVVLAGAGTAYGQSPTAPADPHHAPATAPARPGGMAEPRDGAMMPTMEMCRQMMAGPMMPGAMMGTGADQKMDPKMMAHMLEMRGEMMKAMGEVMMKHGKMMGGAGQ
jgi:hypothetical protein